MINTQILYETGDELLKQPIFSGKEILTAPLRKGRKSGFSQNRNTIMKTILSILAGAVACVSAQTTIDPVARYAWAGNAGWIDFRPNSSHGLVLTEHTLSGYAYAANFGWIHFGDGGPADGIDYSNTSGSDFGVNHDGLGRLTGMAYSGNIGWIVFEQNSGQAEVDLVTGEFSSHAWAPNVGWITLSTVTAASIAIPDSDFDGISDAYEREKFGNLTTANATSNADADDQSDLAEYYANTDPNDPNSRLEVSITSVVDTAGGKDIDVEILAGSGRLLALQYSNDVATISTESTKLYSILATPGTFADRIFVADSGSGTDERHFFRILAELPLQP